MILQRGKNEKSLHWIVSATSRIVSQNQIHRNIIFESLNLRQLSPFAVVLKRLLFAWTKYFLTERVFSFIINCRFSLFFLSSCFVCSAMSVYSDSWEDIWVSKNVFQASTKHSRNLCSSTKISSSIASARDICEFSHKFIERLVTNSIVTQRLS